MTDEPVAGSAPSDSLPFQPNGCGRSFALGCFAFLAVFALYAIERAIYYYDPPQVTRLVSAIVMGDDEQVKLCLADGANPNRITRDAWYYMGLPMTTESGPMHVAAARSNSAVFRLLLDAGGDLDLEVRGRDNPLYLALGSRTHEMTQSVLEFLEASPDAVGTVERARTYIASRERSSAGQTTDRVLGSWLHDRKGESTPSLVYACRTVDSLERVRELVAGGADIEEVDAFGWTPLSWASSAFGSLEAVDVLLLAGADPNHGSPEGWTPLHSAVQTSGVMRVQRLLEEGADPNRHEDIDFYTPLHLATRAGNVGLARLLINAGAKTEARDGRARFALEQWSVRGAEEQAEFARLMTGRVRRNLLEVTDFDLSEVELVTGEAVREELYGKMYVGAGEGILENGQMRLRGRVHFSNTSVGLSFNSYWVVDGTKFAAGSVCGRVAHVESRSVEALVPAGGGEIRCLLVPNPELGRKCHHSDRIFGEELSFPPSSITIVDKFSPWNRR